MDDELKDKKLANILPYAFTPENAADNARKAAKARKENKEKAQVVRQGYSKEIITAQEQLKKLGLTKLSEEISREDLPKVSIAIMMDHALRVLGGDREIKSAE